MAENLGDLFIDGEDIIEDEVGTHTFDHFNGGNLSVSTDQYKFGNSSIKFDNSNSTSTFTRLIDHSDFNLAGEFTIDMWLYIPTGTSGAVMGQWDSANPTFSSWLIRTAGTSLKFDYNTTSQVTGNLNFTTDIPYDEWFHIAAVKDNTALKLKLYFNGADAAEVSLGLGIYNASRTMTFGFSYIGATRYTFFNGAYADQIRLVNGEALWTDEFELTASALHYAIPVVPYVRPDTVSGLYNVTTNKRGKALEGYIRPTLTQFYMSVPDYIEVESAVTITSEPFDDIDDWEEVATGGTNSIVNGELVMNVTSQATGLRLAHKGVMEGDFEFTIDYDAGSLEPTGSYMTAAIELGSKYLENRVYYNSSRDAGWKTDTAVNHDVISVINSDSKLRFQRSGSNLSAWIWYNSQWSLIKTYTDFGTGDATLYLKSTCWSFAYSTIAKFDNLIFTTGSLKVYPD